MFNIIPLSYFPVNKNFPEKQEQFLEIIKLFLFNI